MASRCAGNNMSACPACAQGSAGVCIVVGGVLMKKFLFLAVLLCPLSGFAPCFVKWSYESPLHRQISDWIWCSRRYPGGIDGSPGIGRELGEAAVDRRTFDAAPVPLYVGQGRTKTALYSSRVRAKDF